MRIEIKAECRRGLRIIDEIPHSMPGKLEGYNGIGKTSAVRLLQLCTGEQPFRGNDAAWRSFRNQLIKANVRVTNIREADNIEWVIEPHRWPERESDYPDDSKGTTITIDGRTGTIADVKNILRIHHLNVSETPINILEKRLSTASITLGNWYDVVGQLRWDELGDLYARILKLLVEASPAKVRYARQVAAATRTAADEVTNRAQDARIRVQTLDRAVEIANQLDTVRGSSPELQFQLGELQDQLIELDARRETLNAHIGDVQIQKHLTEQAEENLEKLQKLVARHDAALRRKRAELEHAAAAAHVVSSVAEVTRAIGTLENLLNELLETQPSIAKSPQLLAVLNDLVRRLDDAISDGLEEQILIETGTSDTSSSVGQLREVLISQAERIAEHSRTSDAEELEKKISAARNRLDSLAVVEELLDSVSRVEERLANAEERLTEAAGNLSGPVDHRLNELMRLRNELDKEGRDLQSRIDRLTAEIELLSGGLTEEALAIEFNQLCADVDVDPSRVRGRLEKEQEKLNSLAKEEAICHARDSSAQHDLQESLAAFVAVIEKLSSDENLRWLRRAIPSLENIRRLGLDEQLAQIESLDNLLAQKRRTLDRTLESVRGIGAALAKLSVRLHDSRISGEIEPSAQGNARLIAQQVWDLPAKNWLAGEAKQWLDDEVMRLALFDGGHDISVNPDDLTVSWRLDGEEFERPLSLFSSGQQAFAFTRARVAQLDRSASEYPNRLIALDEFGAFLDAERLAGLSNYLIERQARIANDHVLVILPCGVPRRELKRETGKQSARDSQLWRRGYFTELLKT
jgi:hypothetical protein